MEQIREQVLRPLQKHNRKCCQTFSDGTRFVDHSKRLGFSGRELVEQIIENPYLQYFIGLPKYQETASFDPSALVSFRKRIDLDMAVFLNDSILADTSAELPERKRLSKKHDRCRNDKGNPSGGIHPVAANLQRLSSQRIRKLKQLLRPTLVIKNQHSQMSSKPTQEH